MPSTPLKSQAIPFGLWKSCTLQSTIKFLKTCRKHQKDQTQCSDSPHWYITLCCLRDHISSWIRGAESPTASLRPRIYCLSEVSKATTTYMSSPLGRSAKWDCILLLIKLHNNLFLPSLTVFFLSQGFLPMIKPRTPGVHAHSIIYRLILVLSPQGEETRELWVSKGIL